jgi:TolB-like protein
VENALEDHALVPPDAALADAVRHAVDRVVRSSDFNVPERARKFLTYIVDETLDGRADRIKAYSIAIEVFGRSASFDAQSDPVVRIEAGRVRRALEHYYLTAGRDDPILIEIPKGGYVPNFSRRDGRPDRSLDAGAASTRIPPPAAGGKHRIWPAFAALAALVVALAAALLAAMVVPNTPEQASFGALETAAAPQVPRLVVLPFADLSGTPVSAAAARGLTDEVIGQIAKFREIVVMLPVGAKPTDAAPSGDSAMPPPAPPPRYALEGSVRMDEDRLRLMARLISRSDGTVIWADSYDEALAPRDLMDIQTKIAAQLATAVAQPYGAIFSTDAAQLSDAPLQDREAYACTLAYYTYRADLRPDTHKSVEACLQRTAERFPNYATAWALLSLTYLDEVRFRYAVDAGPTPPLDQALAAARRAVELDPENVRGMQAYMTALFFSNDVKAALKIGARAVETNPNDTELVGEYGMRLALSGEWQKGRALLLQVLDRNPGPLGYFESVVALSYYMQGDYLLAATWIKKAKLEANPIYHLIAAAIFGQLGEAKQAHAQRDWLQGSAPDFLAELPQTLRMRNLQAKDAAHFAEGLRKAGIVSAGL